MKKKKWPKVLALLLAAALIGAIAVPYLLGGGQTKNVQNNMLEYTAARGDVSVTVTGSGRLETQDRISAELPAGIETAEVFVERGDIVREGQLIASLAPESLSKRAAELSAELSALDMQLMMRKTVGEIASPVKGRIKKIHAAQDADVIETIDRWGSLAVLSCDGLMQVAIKTDSQLSMNAEVEVKWNGGSETGVVAGKTDGGYLITFDDEDAPYEAEADVYFNVEKIGSGMIDIHAPLTVLGNGGTIEKIHKEIDDEITAGTKLFTLSNAPAADSYRKTLADRNEKAQQLQEVLSLLSDPCLSAEADGIVLEMYLQEGEKTAANGMQTDVTAYELGVGGAVSMTVDIDELDIGKIGIGQEVCVTLDAYSAEEFTAFVSRISYIGQNTGSITTYEAQITLQPDARLLPGMNGSAVICTQTAEDALLVPLNAVSEDGEGEYVLMKGAEGENKKIYIETGLSDGTNVQVTSGLSDGDVIVYRGSMSAFMLMQQKMMEDQAAMFGGMQ